MTRYFRIISVVLASSYFWYYARTYTGWHFIDNVNLIFHEAGHTIFFWLPEFWGIAAGSIFQASLPLFFALYFFFHGQRISGALTLLWVGQNLLNISVYAGDAIVMQLPLLGGDSVIHDWNYLLSMMGILRHTQLVAATLYTFALIIILLGMVLGMYFAWIADKDSNKHQII